MRPETDLLATAAARTVGVLLPAALVARKGRGCALPACSCCMIAMVLTNPQQGASDRGGPGAAEFGACGVWGCGARA
jgi:hypothetical protein